MPVVAVSTPGGVASTPMQEFPAELVEAIDSCFRGTGNGQEPNPSDDCGQHNFLHPQFSYDVVPLFRSLLTILGGVRS